MAATTSMNIIVVGAGIAGLSAAVGLRRAGHRVKVLERSSMAKEVGAAVTVPPNATRVLRALGVDFTDPRFVRYKAMQVVRADSDPMKEVKEYNQAAVEGEFGAPYVLAHRVDLHAALWELAIGGGDGITVDVITDATVISYDAREGSVMLADGLKLTADLIVAADGVHSRANAEVLGYEMPAVASALTVIRFMIPSKIVLQDPQTAQLLGRGDGHVSIYVAADSQRWLVRYPCRNNELQNFGAYSSNDNEDAAVESWNTQANRDSLLRRLHDFHPAILSICHKTTEILPLWKCADREPLPRLHLGKLVLVGDAAHPMLPNLGQGAAQAIEDGGVLGVLCRELHDVSDLPRRLELFEKARWQRVSAAQALSMIPVGVDSTDGVTEKLRDFFTTGKVPTNRHECLTFLFSHDSLKEAEVLLHEHLESATR